MTKVNVNYTTGRPEGLVIADYTKIDPLFIELISLCTPHKTEHHISRIIAKQPFIGNKDATMLMDKEKGNIVVQVGEIPKIETMFSCHMDIVGENHKSILEQDKVETIFLLTPDPVNPKNTVNYGVLYGAKRFTKKEDGKKYFTPSTLGADDKVGVYTLLRMIEAKIPGMYIFHTGEECGAIGSSYLARSHKKLFEGIKRAIAFDRAGYDDVICFQRGKRCASKEFGEALASELNKSFPEVYKKPYKGDQRGTFTDTASYVDFIPECTNISVGYFSQHGSGEHFDWYWYNTFLLPAILKVDWESLPTKRNPKKTEYSYSGNYSNYNNTWSDKPRKSWKEATKNTPYAEFPLWEPNLGHMPEHDAEIVREAIGHYITRKGWGKDKEEVIDMIYGLYEMQSLLMDEIKAGQAITKKLLKKEDLSSSELLNKQMLDKLKKIYFESSPTDVELLEFIRKYDPNYGKITGFTKDPRYDVKKKMIEDFVNILKLESLTEKHPYKDLLLGANRWVSKNANKKQLSKKDMEKIQKIIYRMAFNLDIDGTLESTATLLDKYCQHIQDHAEEEWPVVSQLMIEKRAKEDAEVKKIEDQREQVPTVH